MKQDGSAEPKRKAWQIVLELLFGTVFFGICMYGWYRVRPQVLSTVYAEEYPSPSPTAAMAAEETVLPIAYSALNDTIPFVSEQTPIPTPEPTPTPTPEPTPVPTKNPAHGDTLYEGDVAPIVVDIAIRLMELDYLEFEQPTQDYTEGTADAIRAFQLRNGLEVSGACDPETFSRLFDENALSYALVRGSSGEEVALVKERLIDLGYLPESDTSDIYGEKTEEAVRLFRMRNHLPDDVIVDNDTFEELFAEDSVGYFFAIGDKNEEILHYQQLLFEKGYLSGLPDGIFGKLTQTAISRFQEENGLVVDGNLTRPVMTLLDAGDAVSFLFQKGTEGEDVRHLQSRLARLNYLTSSQETGYYGDKTAAAMQAFQKRNGLKETGAADSETIAALHSGKAIANPTPTPKPTAKPTPKPTATPKPASTPKATQTPKPANSTTADPTERPTSTPKPTAVSTPESGDTGSGGSTIDYGEGIEAFLAIAESKLGSKYVNGGKGPNTFDCSGFVYWCLNQAGVKQSYMTSKGWRTCKKYLRIESMKDMKRGDIIVFSGTGSGKGHVGIYLGNGKMIDASYSTGMVRITDSVLTGKYWKEHFLMAYRIWD